MIKFEEAQIFRSPERRRSAYARYEWGSNERLSSLIGCLLSSRASGLKWSAIKAVNGVGNICPPARQGQNRYERSPRDIVRRRRRRRHRRYHRRLLLRRVQPSEGAYTSSVELPVVVAANAAFSESVRRVTAPIPVCRCAYIHIRAWRIRVRVLVCPSVYRWNVPPCARV